MKSVTKRAILKTCTILLTCVPGAAIAGFNPNCTRPPGYSSDRAKWDSLSREISRRLLTPSGAYDCQKTIKTTNNPESLGYKNYWKTVCGPFALVEEKTYRPCTIEERAGIPSRYDIESEYDANTKKRLCAFGKNITFMSRLDLVDKGGSKFNLANSFHFLDMKSEFAYRESCTSELKTTTTFESYRVGETNSTVTIEAVNIKRVQLIPQPSL